MGILARVTLGQELGECFVVLVLNIYTDQGTKAPWSLVVNWLGEPRSCDVQSGGQLYQSIYFKVVSEARLTWL